MSGIGRVAGYEYEYDFCIKEELVSAYSHKLVPGVDTSLIFEIKTSFVIKTINGEDEIIDSEVLHTVIEYGSDRDGMVVSLNCSMTDRLLDYWMGNLEIHKFDIEAIEFAKRAANAADPPPRLVPVFVDFKVRTVQLNGEPVTAAMDRAIRAEYLIPFFEWPYSPTGDINWRDIDIDVVDFLRVVDRKRVGDIEQGLATMRVCDACSRGPFIGCQISWVLHCNHAMHSHCYARWLLQGNKRCPTCRTLLHQPQWYHN